MAANMNEDDQKCCNRGWTESAVPLPALIIIVGFLVCVVRFNTDVLVMQNYAFAARDSNSTDPSDGPHLQSSKVKALLASIREKTRLAADGADYAITAKQRSTWNAENPCLSRSELPQIYASRTQVSDLSPNSLWNQVLETYSSLHRACKKRVGNNFTDYFIHRANESIPGCNFVIGQGTNGLGNNLLVTVSALLYAVVTQRVLLVPFSTGVNNIICEPFEGSSWILDASAFQPNASLVWESEGAFAATASARWRLLEEAKERGNCSEAECGGLELPPLPKGVMASSGFANWQPTEWFYCSMEQESLSEVPWVYLSGCIYFVPKIFASPAFGSTLRELFPENLVLTRLLRSTMLPNDRIWGRFKRLNHAYFDRAARRVGIQVRFFHDHEAMSETMNDQVMGCVLMNGILPNVSDNYLKSTASRAGAPISSPITMVYIASLFSELYDRLKEHYLRNSTVTGEDVGVVQLTDHIQQSGGLEENSEAMVEVLLLSVTDALLVTPVSTFGGLAQAYGGLVPWFIRATPQAEGPPCERAHTVDTCQQGGSLGYTCPYPDGDGELVHSQIMPCIDAGGVQVPLKL